MYFWTSVTSDTLNNSFGFLAPSVIFCPLTTVSPSLTLNLTPKLVKYSFSSKSFLILTVYLPPSEWIETTLPEISEINASPFGVRASNNSATLGKPWVISPPATPPVWKVLSLELLGMYPNCKKKNYDTKKKSYINAMIKFVEDNHIRSPRELEDRQYFHNLVMKLNEKTNNLAYSILFLFNIYIELIPKFTTAYINVNFVINTLYYYLPHISTNIVKGKELCFQTTKDHDFICKTEVKYELLENIQNLVDMIPASINIDYYINNIFPHYKKIINEKKNNIIYKEFLTDTLKYHIIDDEYEYYRYDPKTLEHLKIFI